MPGSAPKRGSVMQADKAYLNDVSARSLAFQIVDQQLLARKAEVDALNKQNEILRLTGALDRKEVETGRLYIVVLLASLGAIGWLLLWLRRSQLRFMRYPSSTAAARRRTR